MSKIEEREKKSKNLVKHNLGFGYRKTFKGDGGTDLVRNDKSESFIACKHGNTSIFVAYVSSGGVTQDQVFTYFATDERPRLNLLNGLIIKIVRLLKNLYTSCSFAAVSLIFRLRFFSLLPWALVELAQILRPGVQVT